MKKKHLAGLLAISLLTGGLAACANGPAPATAAAEVTAISTSLANLAAAIQAVPGSGITAAQVAALNAAVAKVNADAKAIAAAGLVTPTNAAALAADVNAVEPLVQPFYPAAPAVAVAVQAAIALAQQVLLVAQANGVNG